MTGGRDGNEVHAEQVSNAAQAIAAAAQAADRQQDQAGQWLDGGLSNEGQVIQPAPGQHG